MINAMGLELITLVASSEILALATAIVKFKTKELAGIVDKKH